MLPQLHEMGRWMAFLMKLVRAMTTSYCKHFFLYFRLLEKIIRPLLDVQIADMNRGFEKTEISSVVDILAQDVHELPTRYGRS